MSTAAPPAAAAGRARVVDVDLLVALAAGALHSLTFVYTDAWPLQIAFVALLAWRIHEATPGRAALLGGAFGTTWLAAGTWWMYVSMHRYGGLPAWMAALAVLLLALTLSLYLAGALALHARLRRGRPVFDALLFAACWLAAELARGVLFTGFPWIASGYAHVDSPLARLAPWIGVYGIGFVAAGLAGLVGALVSQFHAPGRRLARRSTATAVLAAVALAVLAWWPPAEFTRPTTTLQVSLLQTHVPQEQKFDPERVPQALQWLADELIATQADLVVAPETAIPLLPDQLAPEYWQALRERFGGAAAALVGLPLGSYEQGYTNSAAGLSRAAQALPGGHYRYDKHHLVPFGEFIPKGFRWFTEMMNIPLGDFARGPLVAPSFAVHGERVAPNICYEDLFGEQLGARFRDSASAPTIFANLSNIGWFGDTIAVEQHLNISRLRALEFERPMLRATNTGATAIVDHRGSVVQSIAPFTRGRVDGPVQGRDGLTPYARWVSRWGLWPLAALAAAIVAATMALRLRP